MQDLGQVNAVELVGYLHDQGGYCLKKPLKDMGVAVDAQNSYGEGGGAPRAYVCVCVSTRRLHGYMQAH
jgi:hypothetical protein